jgi:predicted DNA-binding transcriptional regulator AlpA
MTPDPFAPLIDSIAARVAAAMRPIDIDALAAAVAARLPAPAAPEPLWSADDVAAFLQLSTRTVRDLASEPTFPAPMIVSGSKRWHPDDIRTWATRQKAERKAA